MIPNIIPTVTGNDINIIVRNLVREIAANGITYESSEHSMNRGKKIQEVWNAAICLTEPRNRIFKSKLQIFNPGLAAIRFVYMISGSDLLEQIAFYTKSVRYFSDDGKTIPGSSYGARIFSGRSKQNQFEMAAEIIMKRSDTKRAVITIYNENDLARSIDSLDIPCVANIIFIPRDNVLHMTVSMRANDAVKILPYNVFEFSLLQECMAARTGMSLGYYWHTAASMHVRGDNIANIPQLLGETTTSGRMTAVPFFSEEIRRQIMQEEVCIRDSCTNSSQVTHGQIYRFWKEYPAIWADILSTLLCEAFRVHNIEGHKWLKETVDKTIAQYEKDSVLLGAYRDFLSMQ